MATGKTIAFTIWTFVDKVMPLIFNMLSRLEPGGLQSMRSQRVRQDWATKPSTRLEDICVYMHMCPPQVCSHRCLPPHVTLCAHACKRGNTHNPVPVHRVGSHSFPFCVCDFLQLREARHSLSSTCLLLWTIAVWEPPITAVLPAPLCGCPAPGLGLMLCPAHPSPRYVIHDPQRPS